MEMNVFNVGPMELLILIPLALVVLVAGLAVYLLPTIIAMARDHANTWVIALLNVFLGGTFVVWVVCLVWAMTGQADPEARQA